jgi:hypothetical protein
MSLPQNFCSFKHKEQQNVKVEVIKDDNNNNNNNNSFTPVTSLLIYSM